MTVHNALSGSELHEPKNIDAATAGAADIGKVIVAKGDGTSEVRKLKQSESSKDVTGWASYGDLLQTSGNKTVMTGAARHVLVNDGNGSFTDKTYLPDGVADLWDSSDNTLIHITPGDVYQVRVIFKIDGAGANDVIKLSFREKGGSLDFFNETIVLQKSAGVQHDIVKHFTIFADADSVANGVEIAITPDTNTNLWDVFIMVTCIHKG